MKHILKVALPVTALALLTGSCKNEIEDVFDLNATQRIEKMMAECDQKLQDSDFGWRFDYTPSNGSTVNYVMKFKDGYVSMENAEGATSTSTYKIVNAEGPVLSFDTYSILHDLADPSQAPQGTGKGGEFEFIISKVGEDTLYLKGRKSGSMFKMARAPQGEIQHIRLQSNLDVDAGKDISFFHALCGSNNSQVGIFLGAEGKSLEVLSSDENFQNIPVSFSENGFTFSTPVQVGGQSISKMIWDNNKQVFTTEDGQITLNEVATSPFNVGQTVQKLLSTPYLTMQGASASATLQLVEFAKDFPEWKRMEFFMNTQGQVETLKYKVNTDNQVTEISREQETQTLNSMSCIVSNEYGLAEWGNFTIKRNEPIDADQVIFVEGIRNGTPANTLNRNIFFKKIKGIFFDSEGVSVVYRNGMYYIVSASDSKMWLILKEAALPVPAITIPKLVTQ